MYLRLCTILLLWFSTVYCGGGSSSSDSSNDTESVPVTNAIAGTWLLPFPGIESCIERYTFDDDGTIAITSNNEMVTGIYTFEETVNSGERHALFIQISTDNGASDCAGNSADDVGLALTMYLMFTSSTEVNWYSAPTGGELLVTMTKEEE